MLLHREESCTLIVPGSITTHHDSGLSRSPMFITCYIHKEWNFQGRAQPARNFSLFFVRHLRTRESDDWHWPAMFFQGPIGLDGPKGDPVSLPYNLHFNFVAGLIKRAKLIVSSKRERRTLFTMFNIFNIALYNRIRVMDVPGLNHNVPRAVKNLFYPIKSMLTQSVIIIN